MVARHAARCSSVCAIVVLTLAAAFVTVAGTRAAKAASAPGAAEQQPATGAAERRQAPGADERQLASGVARRQQAPGGAEQQQDPAERRSALADSYVFRAVIEMVRVPVVVVDVDGSFVGGLGLEDFLVEDGGALQQVEHFVSEHDPTSVVIVLDAGTAAAPIADELRRAGRTLRAALRPEDEVAVIRAGQRAETLVPLSHDAQHIDAAIAGFETEPSAGPALLDALLEGIAMLRQGRFDKRTLIVFGVDADAGSDADLAAVKDAAQRYGVTVHGVWIGTRGFGAGDDGAGPRRFHHEPLSGDGATIAELVRFTGGLLARRPGIEDRFGGLGGWMLKACDDISRYVNHQYLLHYTPLRPPRPGTWRDIRVRLQVPFDEVRARSGYVR